MAKPAYPTDQAKRLAEARRRKGYDDAKAAAKAFGWNYDTYIQHERGERGLRRDVAAKYAKAYGVTPAWLLTGEGARLRQVPVIGFTGAGGTTINEPVDNGEIEADAPDGTVAVRIRGGSLGAGFDGWYALYSRRFEPFDDSLVGKLCVVETEDGRSLIKWVRRGPGRGVNLVSGTGDIEEDVLVLRAAPVIDLKPA